MERFEYLGTIVTADGKVDKEIKYTVKKENKIHYQLANTKLAPLPRTLL